MAAGSHDDDDAEDAAERDPVEVLVEEYFERRRRGERDDVDAFARRVPGREAEFKAHVATMGALESAAAAAANAQIGERLGRFRLLRQVGRGGMGVVFEAADDELHRRVALKVLPGHATLDAREITRFHREAQAAARLRHPHIVPVFGAGEDRGTHWLAMQFVPGESLESVLRRAHDRALMAPRDVARHGLAIAEALACAHAEGVLHRNVKPSNLLLDTDGEVWITDFGLAKSEGAATLTRTGETLGTPRYMAPEAFLGWADPRTDLWGVGATLYELLAGRPAFDGGDRAQLLRQISDVEPVALRKLDPAIPRDLATIVHRCLQKEPAARYASAQELADDLRRFIAGEPIRARPPSLVYRAGLIGRRHPVATALLFCAIVAGAAMTLNEATRARAAEKNSQKRFDDLRRLAGSFLFEIHDAIRNLPGSTQARALVVRRSLEYLDGLAAEGTDDPALRRDLAAAYQKVGDVQGNPYQPNLGDVAGARKSYATSIGLLEPLVAARDASDEDRALLAGALLVGGGIEVAAGSTDRAVAMSQRGLDLRRAIAAHDPSPARREELATASQYAAFSFAAADRNEEAQAALREQESIVRELMRARPDDASLRRAWGMNRCLEAHQLEIRKDRAGARKSYEEAVEVRRALLASDPKNTTLRRDVAFALMDLGNLLDVMNEPAAAESAMREVLALHLALAKADADSNDARVGVELAQLNLGDLLLRTGKPEEAIDHLSEAVRLGEAIHAADSANAWAEYVLAKASCSAGHAHATLGDSASLETACDSYRKSLEVLERMKAGGRLHDPKDPLLEEVRKHLAECEAKLDR